MAKSNKERQAELVARREAFGFKEVRGLYGPTDKHAEIRARERALYPLPEGAKGYKGKE